MRLLDGIRLAKKGVGRLVVALALVLLASGPILDPLICGGEDNPVVASHQGAPVASAAPAADSHGDVPFSDHGAICPHGHCHHSMVAMASNWDTPAPAAKPDGVKIVLAAALGPSTEPSGLKRPPRA